MEAVSVAASPAGPPARPTSAARRGEGKQLFVNGNSLIDKKLKFLSLLPLFASIFKWKEPIEKYVRSLDVSMVLRRPGSADVDCPAG